MSSRHRAVLAILALAALPTAGAVPALGQSVWLPVPRGPSMSLEGFKPILNEGNRNFTPATSAFFLSARTPVAENLTVIAELPFAHAGVRLRAYGGSGTESSTTLGNPYVGVEMGSTTSPFTADVGVRLPLRKSRVSEASAATVGVLADMDRIDAFAEDLLSVGGHVGIRHRQPSGLYVHARGGPILWVNTASNNVGDNTELLLDYAAQAGYDIGRYGIVGGLSGRTLMTADEGSWSDRSLHHLGVSGSVAFGSVRPGIQARIPLDTELSNALSYDQLRYVIGLNLTVQLR